MDGLITIEEFKYKRHPGFSHTLESLCLNITGSRGKRANDEAISEENRNANTQENFYARTTLTFHKSCFLI